MLHSLASRSLSPAALTALLAASLTPGAVCQTQADKGDAARQSYVIHETTHRVLVDVVVTDDKGKPVPGLKREDFSVREDGKPQTILSFDVEDGDKLSFIPPNLPPMPPNTFLDLPKEPEQGPLYVLVYDMVNTGIADQATTYHPLLNFIDSKPAGTRFAIYVNSDGLHLIQGFTADKDLLHAAVTGRGPGPHIPNQFLLGANYGRGDGAAVTQIFKFLADYLQGVPGRKNLIWLSGGMPASLTPDPNQEGQVDTEGVKSALEAMMRSQIALYPVDVRGVIVAEERAGAVPGGPSAGTGTGISTTAANMLNSDALGNFTGGRSYQGDNDIKALLDEAVADGASYYSLSYAPTNEKYDYSGRHIAVSLAKKGYQLSYRQLYYALPEDAEAPQTRPGTPDARFLAAKQEDTLVTSVEHGAPMLHDLIFRAYLHADTPAMATREQMATLEDEPAYFRTRKKNAAPKPLAPVQLQRYRIDYTVIDPQLRAFAEKTGRPATIEFAAVAYDANGRMLNGMVNDAMSQPPSQAGNTADPKAEAKTRAMFRVEQELYVPAGAAWIRMAVRDMLTNRTGTLEVPLPLAKEAPTAPSAGQ